MIKIEVILVNAFTTNGAGGNPAGVVLNADNLSDAQKLKIAQQVGFSETAFVASDDVADYAVSFFTTTAEVDFCGHATLAVFSTLHQRGILTAGSYVQRTKAGMLGVTIAHNGKVVMEQQLPQKIAQPEDSFSYPQIAKILGIDSQALASTNLPIDVISTGLPDVIIPVVNGYLDSIVPNDDAIADFCEKHNVVGFHVFELCTPQSNLTASCRNFSPLFGIPEESATGSACGALACYLTEHTKLEGDYVFEQGRAMNCTSIITASVKTANAVISKVEVGGFANIMGTVGISV